MNSKANLADNLLLLGVIGVLAVVAFGLLAAIVGTILFAIKVIIVVVAIGIGGRIVNALSGGKKKELGR